MYILICEKNLRFKKKNPKRLQWGCRWSMIFQFDVEEEYVMFLIFHIFEYRITKFCTHVTWIVYHKYLVFHYVPQENKRQEVIIEIYRKMLIIYHKRLCRGTEPTWSEKEMTWYLSSASTHDAPQRVNCMLPNLGNCLDFSFYITIFFLQITDLFA